jgi:hypothetical protein
MYTKIESKIIRERDHLGDLGLGKGKILKFTSRFTM